MSPSPSHHKLPLPEGNHSNFLPAEAQRGQLSPADKERKPPQHAREGSKRNVMSTLSKVPLPLPNVSQDMDMDNSPSRLVFDPCRISLFVSCNGDALR